jgi:hypothetical protein
VSTPQEFIGKLLGRKEILEAEVDADGKPSLPFEYVEVPEWGGTVCVQGLTGTGRDAFEATLVKQRGRKVEQNTENFRAKLIAQSLVDGPGGRLLFTERDVPALGRKSASALERVYDVATRLSRLRQTDVEELTEELGEEESEDSGSGSLLHLGSQTSSDSSDELAATSSQNG